MSNALKLYLLGLLIHIFYALIVYNTDNVISPCLQKDNGQLEELIIQYNYDSKSYIDSADNFIKTGVFGKGIKPDYERTVGYPGIIVFFKYTFGEYWYYGLVLMNIFIGALIYPISYLIGRNLLVNRDKTIFISVVFFMMLGGYFTRSFYVLTDLIFSVLFLLGVLLSIISVKDKDKLLLIILSIIVLSIAGVIRPIMLIYPIAHILLLIYVSKKYSTFHIKKVKYLIWGSGLILIFTCNISSFRVNYYYNAFTPTDILGKDLIVYTAKSIYTYEDKFNDYLKIEEKINSEKNWIIQDKMRKKVFFETVYKYPISTLRYLTTRGALVHLFYPHFMQIGEIYGYFNKNVNRNDKPMKESSFMKLVLYFFSLINIVVFFLFLLYMFERLFLHKEILFFVAIMSVVFFIVGPTFIAASSSRMRIPIEPIIFLFAFEYLFSKKGYKFYKAVL